MNTNIQMVVFDMAGTTINEDNLVYKTLRNAINEAGFSFSLEQVLAEGAGKEKKQAIRTILKSFSDLEDEELIDRIYNKFLPQLTAAYRTSEIIAQPNALALFAELKKRNIFAVLNTGYDRETAQSLIDHLGWAIGKDFDALITASDVEHNRPDPDMILLAMQMFNIMNGHNVAKVGDSIIDIQEGRNAGCSLCVGITTGAHSSAQLASANPDGVIDNLIDLLPLID